MELPPSNGPYAVSGGGGQQPDQGCHKRPAACTPVLKNPASVDDAAALKKYVTPRTTCDCGRPLAQSKGREISAVVYSFAGLTPVLHVTKRCTNKSCNTYFGYNYKCVKSGELRNSIRAAEASVLFVNAKLAFCTTYLRYHDGLHFRGFLSAGAIAFAGADVLFGDECHSQDWFPGNTRMRDSFC